MEKVVGSTIGRFCIDDLAEQRTSRDDTFVLPWSTTNMSKNVVLGPFH